MKIPEVVDISYQILSALLRDLEVDEDGFATILVIPHQKVLLEEFWKLEQLKLVVTVHE